MLHRLLYVRFPSYVFAILLLIPVGVGLLGVIVPAFGYLPILGGTTFSLAPWRDLFEIPRIWTSIGLTIWVTIASTALSLALVHTSLAFSLSGRVLQKLSGALSPVLAAPHAAFAVGLVLLMTPSGLLFRFISPWATGWTRPPDLLIAQDEFGLMMILGLTLKETPFLLLMALSASAQQNIPEH